MNAIKTAIENAKHNTDEIISNDDAIGHINSCIAYLNTETGTNLPFIDDDFTIGVDEYDAITDSWQIVLFENWLSFKIFSNDANMPDGNIYQLEFLRNFNKFVKRGLKGIKIVDDAGEATGYEGTFKRVHTVTYADNEYGGWF